MFSYKQSCYEPWKSSYSALNFNSSKYQLFNLDLLYFTAKHFNNLLVSHIWCPLYIYIMLIHTHTHTTQIEGKYTILATLRLICAQTCLALRNPMDSSLPGSSVCGILQARILEWAATSSSSQAYITKIKFLPWTKTSHGKRRGGEILAKKSVGIFLIWQIRAQGRKS